MHVAAGKVAAAKAAEGIKLNGESETKAVALDEEDNSVGTNGVATSYFLRMVEEGLSVLQTGRWMIPILREVGGRMTAAENFSAKVDMF